MDKYHCRSQDSPPYFPPSCRPYPLSTPSACPVLTSRGAWIMLLISVEMVINFPLRFYGYSAMLNLSRVAARAQGSPRHSVPNLAGRRELAAQVDKILRTCSDRNGSCDSCPVGSKCVAFYDAHYCLGIGETSKNALTTTKEIGRAHV